MRARLHTLRYRFGVLSRPASVLLFVALLCGCPSVAAAGINVWTSNGPEGGVVRALAIDPNMPSTLYAGTTGGVFKSTNAGANWRASGGLTDTSVTTIDPLVPSTLYASTDGGLFKSTDGGANWKTLNQSASTLAIDPLTPSTLYAATLDGGLVKSTDGGASWNASNTGLPSVYSPPISALAIDPQTPSTLYAGKRHGNSQAPGVFRSTDGGASWHVTGLNSFDINALAIDLPAPNILYAGEYGADGVVKSTDGGGSWSSANNGLPESPSTLALAVDPHTPSTLYAIVVALFGQNGAVFQSADGGQHWMATGAGLVTANVLALVIDPLTPTTLYAGTAGDGVFKSSDGGASWVASSTGLMLNLVVDSTADAPDAHPGDGVCASAEGTCTLRAAIDEANAGSGGSVINVPAGTYPGSLGISVSLTLNGAGAAATRIDGGGPVVSVSSGAVVDIRDVTIQNGVGNRFGGGVENGGTLTLTNSTVRNNTAGFTNIATPAFGGGIANFGEATLTNVTVSGNHLTRDARSNLGGGIYNGGRLSLTNVTVSDNTLPSSGAGGGLYNGGTATLTNCTLSGNHADYGGGIENSGTAMLTNCTLSGNSGTYGGRGVSNSGTSTLTNTIVANSVSGANCSGTMVSMGHNLDSDGTCTLSSPGDLSHMDPNLGQLQDNGGTTFTHALLRGSPAIDAGDDAVTGPPLNLTTDQRGLPRKSATHVDIGAYEVQRAGAPACVGNCSGDRQVSVADLLTMVNIALGNSPVTACEAGDGNLDGQITVDEILVAVNNALVGCPAS